MKFSSFILTALALGLGVTTQAQAQTQVLTFDDLGTGLVASGYAGLQWDNVYSLNTLGYGASGFVNGTVSPNTIIYNGFDDTATISSSSSFNLISLDLTAGWEDGLLVAIDGYDSQSNLLYESYFTLSSTTPLLATLNYVGVFSVSIFTSTDAATVLYPAYGGSGAAVAIDNMTISGLTSASPSAVPEPETYGVMATVCLLGLISCRRRKASGRRSGC